MKEEPKRLAPTVDTLRALFAKSGNECAFPDCHHLLVDEDNEFVAQVCHIEDAMPGCRFNEDQTNEERRSYNNLILFCYRHHIKTNDPLKYTVKKLKEIKQQHEEKFQDTFQVEDITLINIFNDLKSIKQDTQDIKRDTTEILETVQNSNQQFEELKELISKGNETKKRTNASYLGKIESAIKLRDSNGHTSALKILDEIKNDNWQDLAEEERYKLLANIGIITLELNKFTEGAQYLIDAYKHNPDDEKALGLAALGYSMMDQPDKAQPLLDKAISKNTQNPNIYLAIINLKKDTLSFSELLNEMPEELQNTSEISYALGGVALHHGLFESAINWFQKSVDKAERKKADLQAALAATVLESVKKPFHLVTGQMDTETKNKINYCIELLTESWNEIKETDLRKSRTQILVNRGIAKKFLKDFKGAYEDIKLANTISENEFYILKHLAIISFETNKLDEAVQILDQIKALEPDPNKDDFNIDLFKAEILLQKKEYDQSIKLLKEVVNNTNSLNIKREAESAMVYANMAMDNFEEAKRLCSAIVESDPKSLRGYIDGARVYASLNEPEESVKLLNTAYQQLEEDSDYTEIYDLAHQFYKYKDYTKSIELLERITEPGIFSKPNMALIRAYYQAGENGKVLELCEEIRSNHGPIDLIAEMQSTIYESIDDLPKAIDICEEYLKIYPDDQRIQIRLALIYARIKDETKVKKILDKLSVLGDLPLNVLYQLAYLNLSIGEIQRGLKIAFETRRKYLNIPETHTSYIGLLNEFRILTEPYRAPDEVSSGTAVRVRVDDKDILTYYIVDQNEKPLPEDLLIKDTLAQELMGKKVGEIVTIDRSLGNPQKFEILAILSKYNYAFLDSMELLNKKFVGVGGFSSFNALHTGNIREDLKPIFDSLDEQEKVDKQIHEFYQKGIMTVGTISGIRHQNPIKMWSYVLGNPDLGIHLKECRKDEVQIAQILLENGNGLVIDLVSLLTFAAIDRLDLIASLPNIKAISRSTIESIDMILRDLESSNTPTGYLALAKVGDEYVRQEVTQAQIQQQIERYKKLSKWLQENCEILPCNEALTINAAKKEQFDQTLGKPFIDAILIAKENDFLFLSDEAVLRTVAINDFQVKGTSSYGLLAYCLSCNLINREEFNVLLADLIRMNYKSVPMNSGLLMKCAEFSKFEPTFPFDSAVKTLDYLISSEDSSLRVATDFFYNLMNTEISQKGRMRLIKSVLEVLVNGRHLTLVIQKLLILIQIRFKENPNGKQELNQFISEFVKSVQ